jgi:hypothetical protein
MGLGSGSEIRDKSIPDPGSATPSFRLHNTGKKITEIHVEPGHCKQGVKLEKRLAKIEEEKK